MVAVTLLSIGLLALAAATATLARHRRDASLGVLAAGIATERAARLTACLPDPGAPRDVGALRARWTARDDRGVRTVTTVVEHVASARRWTFETGAPCASP